MSTSRRMRCAIYTRTSSDEHLGQEFNSLHAQREACEAFIRSQSGEGWQLLPDSYEDGGFSGGKMDRPALQQLLDQVRQNRIDVVVVYKIDRLTRSLMDFARIVEIFDAHGVSFVSVTQAFNTTTSMGRLTLNVLLSFAQFEREVTAERIRDKITASKKKGMWMGGNVPLGYRVENRKLLIHEIEAETIRFIFRRYLELKSIRKLADEINRSDKVIRRGPPRNGTHYITDAFRSGNLRHLLANPVYVGKVRHRDKIYEGEHEGLIDPETFEHVQLQLKEHAPKRRYRTNMKDVHLLTGILYDETGDRLTPTHAKKRGVRYRYYVSKRIVDKGRDPAHPYAGWRIRAGHIDSIVENQLRRFLQNGSQLMEWFGKNLNAETITQLPALAITRKNQWSELTAERKQDIVRRLFARITIRVGWIRFEVDRQALLAWLMDQPRESQPHERATPFVLEQPMSVRRRGVESRMVVANGASMPRPDAALIDFVVRANTYLAALTDGSDKTLTQVAREQGTDVSEVSRLLPFAFLAPHVVESILSGNQPFELGALRLGRISDLPVNWQQQAELLGF
jgi:site-specific DNA recombinase